MTVLLQMGIITRLCNMITVLLKMGITTRMVTARSVTVTVKPAVCLEIHSSAISVMMGTSCSIMQKMLKTPITRKNA